MTEAIQEIERPPSLADIATEKLRSAIMNGEFELGEALSEKKLADRFNISKTPIRHALAQMKTEGLVAVYPQRGTFVFTLSGMDLVQFSEHRIILEREALSLSFERNHSALVAKLEKIWNQMQKANDAENIRKYLELDTRFHRCFFDLCENFYLSESYSLIEAKIAAIRTHLGRNRLQTDKSYKEHKEMLEALRSRDLALCQEILKYHIGRYLRTYSQDVEDIAKP
nr:GntR family transcriptional regulator [uncultured Cohaesibacter sp.]